MTLALFPLLYLTLELPKRIINDAIGAPQGMVEVWGREIAQLPFLMLLCGVFLLAVLVHGLMKMYINTRKGILSERLLRRLRYIMIARMLRFPAPYFERVSQGELVSMVTSEAEPMGGLMGDAVAQPVLQAGQMLTILAFLFLQSFAFGLAACALIPLQAWLIPRLQRQINQLNKARVIEVRALAAEIGESAAGASTLRINGGARFRLALISRRLGRLTRVRFEIYQKKFLMKFVNNFIGQLTPFFFYAVGGTLAIRGEITVGALVAALAAYKDLSSPWKELLAYYNQTQDMATRWDTLRERFAPQGMLDAGLFEGAPEEIPRLKGDIVLRHVSVTDADGTPVLQDLDVTLPEGSTIGITAPDDEERHALAAVLTRELLPAAGSVHIGAQPLAELHQSVLARRIGYATSRPVLFEGPLGENINMALRTGPQAPAADPTLPEESTLTGNSPDPADVPWLDLSAAEVADTEALERWWLTLLNAMKLDLPLFLRALEQPLEPDLHPQLSKALVALRPEIGQTVREAGLAQNVSFFDMAHYNPSLPVAENLIFATPLVPVTAQVLIDTPDFMALLERLSLDADLLDLAAQMLGLLRQIFGVDGTDHPLFQKLGLEAEAFDAALEVLPLHQRGAALTLAQKAQMLAVPFVIPAEKIGRAFPQEVIARVLEMRKNHADALQRSSREIFAPLDFEAPVKGLSVLENTLFGKLCDGADSNAVLTLVGQELSARGLAPAVLNQLFDLPLGLGGRNLPRMLAEPLAVGRAAIKRPDIMLLESPLESFEEPIRDGLPGALRELLPHSTIICLARAFDADAVFDHRFEIRQGRLSTVTADLAAPLDQSVSADLARKLRALEQAELFAGLARKQLRLLAFGARWYEAKAGDYVFRQGDDPSSGAFLVIEGEADLVDPSKDAIIGTVTAGALVGELGLIRKVPRALDMRAKSDLNCLRIGEEEFMDVVRHDAATAYKLLQVVAGYV